MPGSGGEANEVDRLKTLLFSAESHRLSEAEVRLDGLEGWVGDAGRLEAATAEVLVEALRRAEVARHRELAAAVAPVVVAAIRSEIHNSRDMMVEALYPITGRLVAAAVANAFKDLIAAINQRLDSALSTESWSLRLKSWATGRSVAELALAQARGGNFVRLLLLERGSGRLLAHWEADGVEDQNSDLVSGMIAAITEFASTVLSDRGGELRTLDLGASQVYLRASQRVILAGELVGIASREDTRRIESAFLELVDRHDRGVVIGTGELADFAVSVFPGASDAPRRGSPAAAILAALLVLGLGAALYTPGRHALKAREIDAAFRAARAADPELAQYPLRWRANWTAGIVGVHGLAGSAQSLQRLTAALGPTAAPMTVEADARIVASAEDSARAREALAQAQLRIDALGASLDADAKARRSDIGAALAGIDALASRIDGLTRRLQSESDAASAANEANRAAIAAGSDAAATRIEALGGKLGDLSARLDASDAAMQAAREIGETRANDLGVGIDALKHDLADIRTALTLPEPDLGEVARGTALFFGDRDEFADPAEASRALDLLVKAIQRTGQGVRVVGYADETGSPVSNVEVSRARAEKAARLLVERGVSSSRLTVVGRGSQSPIADASGPNRLKNRRVVFELLYGAEASP